MGDSSGDPWMDEAVQLRLPTGEVRFLLQVRRERCPSCRTGTRMSSVWSEGPPDGEAVAWCGHCFNATCEVVLLDEEHRLRLDAVAVAVERGSVSRQWTAARPALEDLERRGLI